MTAFLILYAFLLLERLAETVIARRNARWILERGGVEHDAPFTRRLILFHVAWFTSFLAEGLLRPATPVVSTAVIVGATAVLQGVRYWCILTLGRFWNTRILVLPGSNVVSRGPYGFLKHPNYLVVLLEIPLYPALMGCWVTAAVFGVTHIRVVRRRIRKEEAVVASTPAQLPR